MQRIIVPRTDLTSPSLQRSDSRPLESGEVRLRVERFGFSANNITYAVFGDALGYWAYFPVDDDTGCIPVWGFSEVVESRSDRVHDGERLFGYLPMADEHIFCPGDVSDLAVTDGSPHRVALHPWYSRFYRCAGDPLWESEHEDLQVVMWALFMTGCALADDLADTARAVVVSSASSKTALSLAWTLRHDPRDIAVIGVTSAANADFLEAAGVYDRVTTYDDLDLSGVGGSVAFVDAAGSPAVAQRVHAGLADRLTDSIILGATHQGAGEATGALVGPPRRFFFIPDVAERRADERGLDAYHQEFSERWRQFVPWIEQRLIVHAAHGEDAVFGAYHAALNGTLGPETAMVLAW
jgi:hypothetical protein